MPKPSPEQYSPELLARTTQAEADLRSVIEQVHAVHTSLAEPHLELMDELKDGEVYPFENELNEIIAREDALVAPLIREQHSLTAKISYLKKEQELENEFAQLEERVQAQLEKDILAMQDGFTETRFVSYLTRAVEIAKEVRSIFQNIPKKKEDASRLADLLSEFNEIAKVIMEDKARTMAKDIRKSNDEQ